MKKMRGSINRLIGLLLFLWLLLPILYVLLIQFVQQDQLLLDLIDLIPFGESVYWCTLRIVSTLAGAVQEYSVPNFQFTPGYVIQELAKSLFVSILFEAGMTGCSQLLELKETKGKTRSQKVVNNLTTILLAIPVSLLAACLSPLLLDYIFSNLDTLGGVGRTAISLLVALLLTGGGFLFFFFLLGQSLLLAFLYVVIKIILLNMLRIFLCYAGIFAIVIAVRTDLPYLIGPSLSALLSCVLILCVLDWALDATIHALKL